LRPNIEASCNTRAPRRGAARSVRQRPRSLL